MFNCIVLTPFHSPVDGSRRSTVSRRRTGCWRGRISCTCVAHTTCHWSSLGYLYTRCVDIRPARCRGNRACRCTWAGGPLPYTRRCGRTVSPHTLRDTRPVHGRRRVSHMEVTDRFYVIKQQRNSVKYTCGFVCFQCEASDSDFKKFRRIRNAK